MTEAKCLSTRKRERPMTPQRGRCARAASQAILKESLGQGLACRWGEGAASPSWVPGCVVSAGQALVGRKGPNLSWDWLAASPCQRPLGTAGNFFWHLL